MGAPDARSAASTTGREGPHTARGRRSDKLIGLTGLGKYGSKCSGWYFGGELGGMVLGIVQGPAALGKSAVVEGAEAAAGATAIIAEGKLGYLLGQASGRAHNLDRALQNAGQLARVGVHDTAAGRALLRLHLEEVAADAANTLRTFTDKYGTSLVKESLFGGPGGFLKFESTWQAVENGALRLTSVIPFGG